MSASFPAFRLCRVALLPALLVAVALASPARAQDGGGAQTVSGAVAIDALAQAMRGRGWTPVGDLSLADYIGTEVQDSGTRHVKLWVGPDGRAIPKPAWQTYHPTYCKQQARYLQGAAKVLNFKLTSIPPDGYNAFAQFIDVETGVIEEQQEGGQGQGGVAWAIDAAWGKMNTGVGAPTGPCGEVRLRHVQGEEVDDVFVFQAGFQGSYGQSLDYTWDFGDGSAPVSGGKRARHTYDAEGTYEVSVRVEGENVEPGVGTVSVVVGDEAELTLFFSSKVELRGGPGYRKNSHYEAEIALRPGAGSMQYEGAGPVQNVDYSFDIGIPGTPGNPTCTMSPQAGVLNAQVTLPPQGGASARQIEATLFPPNKDAIPFADIRCEYHGRVMIEKKMFGLFGVRPVFGGANSVKPLHYTGWERSNSPGVVARKVQTGSGSRSLFTISEETTLEIRRKSP